MTRINTNVSSLVAQNTLARSNADLNQSLTRLSTGLRINVGKDDPAGLIASESLRSDIISTRRAITNSERANQLIATADSALGQVSNLINDIRGLVSEAANTGALSEDQIDANQLQVDSSLEAIDRIAQITSFQGRRLLDGTLDFVTTGVDTSKVTSLQIDQANFGTLDQVGITVDITQTATRGSLNYSKQAIADGFQLSVKGEFGAEVINIDDGATIDTVANSVNLVSDATGVKAVVQSNATKGELVVSGFGTDNDIKLTAKEAGFDPGNVNVQFSKGDGAATNVSYTKGVQQGEANTLDIQLKTQQFVAATAVIDDGGEGTQKAEYIIDFKGVDNDIKVNAGTAGSKLAGYTFTATNAGTGGGAPVVTIDTSARTVNIDLDNIDQTGLAVKTALNTAFGTAGLDLTADYATLDSGDGNAVTGAGATIIKTESASAVSISTVEPTGGPDNNLQITAKIAGTLFNDVNVNFVNDKDYNGPTGLSAGSERVFFKSTAQKAKAYVDLTNTSGDNTDFTLTADKSGTALNNTQVVFQAVNGLGNTASAAYDATNGVVTIKVDDAGATDLQKVVDAINVDNATLADLFTATAVDATKLASTIDAKNGYFGEGIRGNTSFSGGDANTLFVHIEENVSTTDQIRTAFANNAVGKNARANELFEATPLPDQSGVFGVVSAGQFSGAFTGGIDGGKVIATANEVIDAINASSAGTVLNAERVAGQLGLGATNSFQEYAYTGTSPEDNFLQFLGEAGSPDIQFAAGAANQALGASLEGLVETSSSATFRAQNANASLKFSALKDGEAFDNISILFEDNAGAEDNTVVFNPEAAAASATLQFTGANNDIKITASKDKTLDFNNTRIEFVNDGSLGTDSPQVQYAVTAPTVASGEQRVLTITLDKNDTSVQSVIDALNAEGTFTAALTTEFEATNDGSGDFTGQADATVGNTLNTGSVNGTLTFRVNSGTTTSNDVVTLLAADDVANQFFRAERVAGSDGTGTITVPAFPSTGLGTDTASTVNQTVTAGGLVDEGTLVISLATDQNGLVTTTANDLVQFFDDPANTAALEQFGISVSNVDGSTGDGVLAATPDGQDISFQTNGITVQDSFASTTVVGANGINAHFEIAAKAAGTQFDGIQVEFAQDSTLLQGQETATLAGNKLTVNVNDSVSTAQDVINAINNDLGTQFEAQNVLGGDGSGLVSIGDSGTFSGGTIEVGTPDGAALLNNSDLTDAGLTFVSTNYGQNGIVEVQALKEDANFVLTDADGSETSRSVGNNIEARVNGIRAVGDGLRATINTANLDLTLTVSEDTQSGDKIQFEITGGGAQFQLGPDVVSNQQARLGIQSVSTATLGGPSGRLFELRSGSASSLKNNPTASAKIVNDAINIVTQLRGRLGAFQRTTLETNIFALNDTLASLTDAESSIRDADFAVETASLTRAQILVQSGTTVLGIANQNPQNVLSLLR